MRLCKLSELDIVLIGKYMAFTELCIAGENALDLLDSHRRNFPNSGKYPFLIGDSEELERVKEAMEYNEESPDEIIETSSHIDLKQWMNARRVEAEEFGLNPEDTLGAWTGSSEEKGSICLHKKDHYGKILPEVYLGIAEIKAPWQLPATLKYGGWNDCPNAEVHCAFFRKWQTEFGAQITGVSGAIIECTVLNPPLDRETAIELAWEQYWYCADIVEQGCESINNLAATLLNSPYWFFWWD